MILDFNHIVALGFLIFFSLILIRMTYTLFFTDNTNKAAETYQNSRSTSYVLTK